MTVKVKGQWKKDTREYNGLDVEDVRKELMAHPLQRRYALCLLELSKVEELVQEGGTKVPTISIVHIELTDGDDAAVTQEMLENRFNVRTGRRPQASLFDGPDVDEDAEKILAGGVLAKREVKCGALATHPEHEGTDWVCRGLASQPGEGPTEGLSIAEAGAADSGRPELPAAPEFSDQTPDDAPADEVTTRRRRKTS
jgi:hypothetical protein